MKKDITIDIIGAGIGGLSTAIALQQNGLQTRVFEQAQTIKPVGAGIILANNAMQVYEKLGLRKEIEKYGNPISSMNVTDSQLKLISRLDLKYFEAKYKVQNIAIHRGKLQQILAKHLHANTLNLNHELVKVEKVGSAFLLEFKNAHTIQSKILLGADGLKSTVRNCLFSENTIRNAYQICWRGVTDFELPKKYQNELNEAWGKGDRFGFMQIAPHKVYWYALKSFAPQQNVSPDFDIHQFESYHHMIRDMMKDTPAQAVHTAFISDLKPTQKWHKENVCLIGDAAHATTPNMGQGACQAIEDAYILSECLQKFDTNEAFSIYQKNRISKAHHVVNKSWALGNLAHWKKPWAIQLRNQLMGIIPPGINRKQSEKIFQLGTI